MSKPSVSKGERDKNKQPLYLEKFRASSYGKSLRSSLYWSEYKPAHYTQTQWKRVLGRDGTILGHMENMHELMQSVFFQDNTDNTLQIDQEEKEYLLLAAEMCLWGSSIDQSTGLGGDITYDDKTIKETLRERAMFLEVFDAIVNSHDVKLKYTIERILYDKSQKLGNIFRAVKIMSYVTTAIHAYERSTLTPDRQLEAHLQWLTANVFARQIRPLMTYAEDYMPIRAFLENNSQVIESIFEHISSKIFEKFEKGKNAKIEMYDDTQAAWSRGLQMSSASSPLHSTERFDQGIFSNRTNFDTRFCPQYEELGEQVNACRKLGLKIVLTSGSFDLVHIGHAVYLEKAKEYGDILVVGVDSDEKIRQRKGPGRPVVQESERLKMVSHLRGVDLLTVKPKGEKKWQLIKTVRPDILIATAETYTADEIDQLEEQYCGKVVVLPPQAKSSTSDRIRQLRIDGIEEAEETIAGIIEILKQNKVEKHIIAAVKDLSKKVIDNA